MSNPVELPEAAWQHRKPEYRPPNLRPVEQTLFILLSHPGEWFVVDETPISNPAGNTAVSVALWRRGCEVRHRRNHDRGVNVSYARWPHPVPSRIGTWL